MSFLFDLLFGKNGGLTRRELETLSARCKFSDYLPWHAYDMGKKTYWNNDGTLGFLWECSPVAFAGDKTANTLEGLLRIGFPERSVLQFILYADPYVESMLSHYAALKTRDNPVVRKTAENFTAFLAAMAIGGKVPLRNFRLFVAAKLPENPGLNPDDIRSAVAEILGGAGLGPVSMEPGRFLDMMRRFFNSHAGPANDCWDKRKPIRKQMIFAETDIEKHFTYLRVGERYFKCLTPQTCPGEIDLMGSNGLTGGWEGMVDDVNQFSGPFLYTLNVVFQDLKAATRRKCDLTLLQQPAGSFVREVMDRKEEFKWAVSEMDKGTKFVRVIPELWVWGGSQKEATDAFLRAKRIWEGKGFIMQEDRGILPLLFISALPFGLRAEGRNVDDMDRDFIMPAETAAVMFPVQADFPGCGRPAMLYVGRKGQLATLDVFDKRVAKTGHNICVAAPTRSGKSFDVNCLVFNYFAMGHKVRIIDIGGSYEKMVRLCGGRYMDFSNESKICLNLFTHVANIHAELATIVAVIRQMAYSATDKVPHDSAETINSLIKAAVKWAWETDGNRAGMDTVNTWFNEFPEHASDYDFDCPDKEKCAGNFQALAHELAFNLHEFTSKGIYGKWFNGPATFDISKDEFVVLELEHLQPMKDLYKVVTLQVLNAVTQDLYLGDRSRPTFIIFDEAWKFLTNEGPLSEVIGEGYRRAAKYNGSFSIVVQSLLDLKQFGKVGEVINSNSGFKFLLESGDFEKALAEKLIDYDPFMMRVLKTVQKNPPKYSEIFMQTPAGSGVARLIVDPYSYYVYTSDPDEGNAIKKLVDGGMTYDEAISEMAKRREKI